MRTFSWALLETVLAAVVLAAAVIVPVVIATPVEAQNRPLLRDLLRSRSAARAGQKPLEIALAGLNIAVWQPKDTVRPPFPLVVFSHGFHGCNTQSRFLMRALADAGYLVMSPNHRDAVCRGSTRPDTLRPEEPFDKAASWNADTYRDRARDVVALLDALHNARAWSDRIEWSKVALAGHSLGGYTVLGLAGAWEEWQHPPITAVLALSPFVAPFVQHGTLRGVHVPVMYQGGTRDLGITPTLKRAGGAFDQTPAPCVFVELDGAGHFAWTDLQPRYQRLITEHALAFLERYIRGSLPAAPWKKSPGVKDLRVKAPAR